MPKLTYKGTAFRQAMDPQAPWLFSFVAPAEDLIKWAGIPKRTDHALIGFQRIEDNSRIERAKAFFSQYGMNQSPTSLVMGIHPDLGNGASAELVLGPPTNSDAICEAELTVTIDPDETLEQAKLRLEAQIIARLARDPIEDDDEDDDDERTETGPGIPTEDEDAEGTPESNTGFSVEGEEDDEDGEDEIELGRSLLKELLERLSDERWCAEHERDIRDLAKPATIIDGQHRLEGARLCERRIPFSIIAIHDCSWQEQVFQFTVVNYTAKGIPDQFITANAALSLTAGELESLQERLKQAGVKVVEYQLMTVINFDPESPFKDLVNLSAKKSDSKIGYKTMVKIGKAWYSGKENAIRQVVDHVYPQFPGRSAAARSLRVQQWKTAEWGDFFKDFWTTIRDHYAGEKTAEGKPLWSVGSNLLIAVVLQMLQEEFFRNLTAQDDEFFEVDSERAIDEMRAKLRKRAKTFISNFKADLFSRDWKTKSLSTGAGRDALRDCFRNIVDSKGAFQYAKSQLITGKTSTGT